MMMKKACLGNTDVNLYQSISGIVCGEEVIVKIKIVTLCLVLSITLIGCTSSNPSNTVIRQIESPDGKYVAFYFIRDLGATTKQSYQLSILNKGEKLGDTAGNIFTTYGEFDIKWDENDNLIVNIKNNEEIFKQLDKYKEIEIKYKTPESN